MQSMDSIFVGNLDHNVLDSQNAQCGDQTTGQVTWHSLPAADWSDRLASVDTLQRQTCYARGASAVSLPPRASTVKQGNNENSKTCIRQSGQRLTSNNPDFS